MTKGKALWILIEVFEKSPKDLFNLFKREAGAKLTFEMTGLKKVNSKTKLSAESIMRIQCSACAFFILTEESNADFAKKWLENGNVFIPKPAKAFKDFPANKLFLVMNAVFNCIRAQHGIVP